MREGEKNGRAVLTMDHVVLLRKLYRKNKRGRWNRHPHGVHSMFSTAALADEYEMSQSAMWSALMGRSWKRRSTDAAGV